MSPQTKKIGRNDPCPCGRVNADGKPFKYKKCCLSKLENSIPKEVLEHIARMPQEPFERGGFLTGRPFLSHVIRDIRVRAVGRRLYKRPITETFHIFILRQLSGTLSESWVESEKAKSNPHTLVHWFNEAQEIILASESGSKEQVLKAKMTGNMQSLLAVAYDAYTLQHCGAPIPQRLLNRLRDENQFQGARYEIAVAGLACRAGFNIQWMKEQGKHCEFIGTHKVTGDKTAFEAKSHYREGVLGRRGTFNSEQAKTKVIDHIREALEQAPFDGTPLIIFDDLNLPLTENVPTNEKKWFREVEDHLRRYGFLSDEEYQKCSALFVTNFSWHFHYTVPPIENEMVTHWHLGNRYSLKAETIMNYLGLAAKQYGHVPALLFELDILSKEEMR